MIEFFASNVETVDDHEDIDMEETLPPVHPGKVLLEDFLKPLKLIKSAG